MLPFPVVYSDRYKLDIGEHVFPAGKYAMIHERLLSQHVAEPSDFVEPRPASDDDVRLVHTPEWVAKLRTGAVTAEDVLRMEVPYSRALVENFWLSAGGSILASRLALERGGAVNLCGGFHHAYPDHGEGFCVIHDVAIAVRKTQRAGLIERAMIVDTDVHHGNGTAFIFGRDHDVFTLSIHQFHNYPAVKPPSSLDINLADRTGDEEYLERLREGLDHAFAEFHPDILYYLAGADPYEEDQLGGLALTIEGLRRRDALVYKFAERFGIPVMVTLAGGYARKVHDTVTIHTNTILALRDALQARQATRGQS